MHTKTSFKPEMAALFFQLFLVERALARAFDSVYERYGITTKQWMVVAVALNSEKPTISTIAKTLHSSHQNVKAIALNLKKAGLIRLVADPNDRRATLLVFTDKMQELERLRADADQENMAVLFAQYSDQELASFREFTERLLGHIPNTLATLI